MGSRQYDRYCEEMYFEWLEAEAEADRLAVEEEKKAEKDDEEYENALMKSNPPNDFS